MSENRNMINHEKTTHKIGGKNGIKIINMTLLYILPFFKFEFEFFGVGSRERVLNFFFIIIVNRI